MKIFNKICLLLFVFIFYSSFTSFVDAKTIHFAVASDVQYLQQSTDDKSIENKTPLILKYFVKRVNENDYDFVVFLGDNIAKSNLNNLNGFLKIVKDIKPSYYLVLGNQDAHKISGIDKKVYLETVSKVNKNQKKPESSYYFCPTSDVIVIVLDNVSSGMPSNHGVFTQRTLKWLDETLTKHENKKAIIFQHVPYLPPYDKESYEILEKNNFRAILSNHDNVLAVFGGHYRMEGIKKDDKGITHINAPALSISPYNYMDIVLTYDKKPFSKAKNFKIDGDLKPAI